MIRRIVKMTFQPDQCDAFKKIFKQNQQAIRHFPGCQHLELWQNKTPPNIFMTYSIWKDEESLENYRHSPLFKATWAKTKVLFSERPLAWSLDQIT